MKRVLGWVFLAVFVALTFIIIHADIPLLDNPVEMVLFVFPILITVVSILVQLSLKMWYVMPTVTCVIFTIHMVTAFNESFFIWVVFYTIYSLFISVITVALTSRAKKDALIKR